MAKGKKLTKEIADNVVTITEVTTNTVMKFDFSKLPAEIQKRFGPFGYGHKLGDSAAGKEGEEAIAAIKAVNDGLMKGEWTTRAPAAPKVTKAQLVEKLSGMTEKEQKIARDLLAKLGLVI